MTTVTVRDASFRGVPFKTVEYSGNFGRRTVVHEYPYRTEPWVEDLGQKARRTTIHGRILGDDVGKQTAALINAVQKEGPGRLLHPTFGILDAVVIDFEMIHEAPRSVDFRISFVTSKSLGFPTSPARKTGYQTLVMQAAALADSAVGSDFFTRATVDLQKGAAVVQRAVGVAGILGRTVTRLGNSATNLFNLFGSLGGNNGRYASGRRLNGLTGVTGPGTSFNNTTRTVNSLINQATIARNNIALGVVSVNNIAGNLTP